MTSDAEHVKLIRGQALATIGAITVEPKPSYDIDGQAVSWGEYLKQLRETVDWCDRQLATQEPFELRTQGYTP